MKTSFIRIIIGILALGCASQGFSQGSKMYLLLEDAGGIPKWANVDSNGTFTSPPLVKGSYTLMLVVQKSNMQQAPPKPEIPAQTTKIGIIFDKAVIRPREITDAKGKHFLSMKSIGTFIGWKERSQQRVERKLGIIAIDEDSYTLTGKIEISTSGKPETLAEWMENKLYDLYE